MIFCPFISQLPVIQQQEWVDKLNSAFLLRSKNNKVNVILEQDLSPIDKKQCKFAIVANPKAEDLKHYCNLVWVQSLWSGVENLVTEHYQSSFEIVRLVDPTLAQIMSEAVLAWTLYLHRQMPEYLAQQKLTLWKQLPHVLAKERTVCILGLGELGRASALVLKKHGFNVTGWSRTEKHIEGISCFFGNQGVYKATSNADIIVCLLPHTPETHKFLNDSFFSSLKQGTSLINFARGGIIDNNDLIKYLNQQHIKHAVLDVFDVEPLQESSELWQHDQITILPHVSAPTHMSSAIEIVMRNIGDYIETNNTPESVDKQKGY